MEGSKNHEFSTMHVNVLLNLLSVLIKNNVQCGTSISSLGCVYTCILYIWDLINSVFCCNCVHFIFTVVPSSGIIYYIYTNSYTYIYPFYVFIL